MNKILSLFDETFVLNYFKDKVLPLYPYFKDIKKVKINPYKKMIWEKTYHVVIEFETYFVNQENKINKIKIICSAHSSESRENAFKVLNYLWNSSLNQDPIELPHPLFYSDEFKGVFYRALRGKNVLHLLKDGKIDKLEKKIKLTANFFARLHELPLNKKFDFNSNMERIETVVPGKERILKEMSQRYKGVYDDDLGKIYAWLIKEESKYSKNKKNRRIIHGDAHMENLIDVGYGKLGIIDFSDFCQADFARDLGTFIQQMEYRVLINTNNIELTKRLKNVFLTRYLKLRKLEMSDDLQNRINLYYYWTSIRTIVYFFLKFNKDERGAIVLLDKLKKQMNI